MECERKEIVMREKKRSHPVIHLLQFSICLFENSLPSPLRLRAGTLCVFLLTVSLLHSTVPNNKKTLLSALVNMG